MAFVLVPVPAEHVLDVMRWVLFRTNDDTGDQLNSDAARVVALLAVAGPEVQSLLRIVAGSTIRDEPLRLRDLADELEMETPDLTDTIEGLNQSALEHQRPLLEVRSETAVGVEGNTGRIAHVSMRLDLARAVRRAFIGASAE